METIEPVSAITRIYLLFDGSFETKVLHVVLGKERLLTGEEDN